MTRRSRRGKRLLSALAHHTVNVYGDEYPYTLEYKHYGEFFKHRCMMFCHYWG